MSNSTPPRNAPQVSHNFDGNVKVLNGTFDRRTEIRKALASLQQDLHRIENQPTQIQAEIRLRVGGEDVKEHVYTVTISSNEFDVEAFARQAPPSTSKTTESAPEADITVSSSPNVAKAVNGQQATPTQSTPRPESRMTDGDDDVIEIRPFKRIRTDAETARPSTTQQPVTDPQSVAGQVGQLFGFVKEWHSEWVRQGGWLYDNISKASTASTTTKSTLEKKLDAVQDVLGQSLNTANVTTMTELKNIASLVPWLEHCRKTSADKIQAREEKWRSSSATFHDQTRKDREAAEKRIEKKLEEQRDLLVRMARASGLDDIDNLEDRESREASLGAQLTAELNMEAAKSGNASRSDAEHETINIDD